VEKGLAVQKQIIGSDVVEKLYASAPEDQLHIQRYLSAHCFGDHYTRRGIDLPTRELLTISMLASASCRCALCQIGSWAKRTAHGLLRTFDQLKPVQAGVVTRASAFRLTSKAASRTTSPQCPPVVLTACNDSALLNLDQLKP
jgi:alkylhydroperoxidase/carboxymuconolactone decarboxylase family protein YurZ